MNIYDIAQKAGVSVATVSRVLNKSQNVSEETRKKVLSVIEGSNFVPNSVARSLSKGSSRNIGFLVPDIENPFFGAILHGISDYAYTTGHNVFMFGTNEDEQREWEVLNAIQPAMIRGLIAIPVSENCPRNTQKLKQLQSQNIPVVLIDRDIAGGGFDGVFSEDEEGARMATQALIDAGHTRIATLCGPGNTRPGRERLQGYLTCLEENGLEMPEGYVQCGYFSEEQSYKAMHTLMQQDPLPTAVLSASNMTTLGIMKYLKERNLQLGKDLAVIGFDDIKELEFTNITLSVVVRPVYQMGRLVMELLQQIFEEEDGGSHIVRRYSVKTELILRGSEKLYLGESK
ncbi:MAG: LacI family DNA-binding transcriptional regulator [Eubacteriales bacterium]|nr:LacI family DNA-binding transcriptional regulator [Eubacteriales bacterium]